MDLEGSQVTSTQHHKLEPSFEFVELSATGDCLALVKGNGRLLIRDDILQIAVPPMHADKALCKFASWSDNERWLITYGRESNIQIWNAETMTMVRSDSMCDATRMTLERRALVTQSSCLMNRRARLPGRA